MIHLTYLVGLIVALCCIVLVDYRYKLAYFYDPRRAGFTIAIAMIFFIVWDIAGIGFDIFYEGAGRYTTGLLIGPHFPLEELFFLKLLSYTTLVAWTSLQRRNHV